MNRFMFAAGIFAVTLGCYVIHEALGAIVLGVILMIWAIICPSCDEVKTQLYSVQVTYGAQPWSYPHHLVYHTTDPKCVPHLGRQMDSDRVGMNGCPAIDGIVIAVTVEPV